MAVNKRLLQGAAAAGEFVPSEHFGVVLYEGDGSSGHSINGGKFGAAGYFTNAGVVTIPSSVIDTNKHSLSVWFNTGSTSGTQTVFEFNTGNRIIFRAASTDSNKANFGGGGWFDHGISFSANTWYHLVITFNSGSPAKIYVNGSLQHTTGNISKASDGSANYLGANNSSGGNNLLGKIDQFRIFQKELSSSQISTLYAETTPESLDPLSEDTTDTLQVLGDSSCTALYRFENNEDDESGNYNGTGTEIQYAAGRYGQAGDFNGSTSGFTYSTSVINVAADHSISFWLNIDSIATQMIIWNHDSNIRMTSGGNILYRRNTSGVAYDITSSTTLSTGRWYHIAASFNTSSGMALYIDNVAQGTNSYTGGVDSVSGDFGLMYRVDSNNERADGKIDQVRFFNKTISASEVTTLYEENSLVASYRFEGNANDDMRAYDGTASNVTYEYGLGFTPDFVWLKNRSSAYSHILVDSSRGRAKSLLPNGTTGELTSNAGNDFVSFDTGGFTVGTLQQVYANVDGDDYVAWCLKANGGTTSSNTDGSITSTVQVNEQAGFSIVKYTGNQSNATIGHGLGVVPEMIIAKGLYTQNWAVYHKDAGSNYWLQLNSTTAKLDEAIWQDTTPTSSVFSVNNNVVINKSSSDSIAYCFHSVEGFSKFGSYTGNGSTNGPIVETGFEPAFLMIKRTDTADAWYMYDNKRNTTNPRNKIILANTDDGELTNTQYYSVDFLSNGFQPRSDVSTATNDNGGTYMYMAFAADPDTEAPTVAKSFSTVAWTGTGSARSITGLGFKPNLAWIKIRTQSYDHNLIDTIRGVDKQVRSNRNIAEVTNADLITSFDDDGVSLGTGSDVNKSGDSFVGWFWKADDNEPTINTEGTIDSLVSANPEAGFSIVKYTTTTGARVGHGLSQAPEIVLQKTLSSANSFFFANNLVSGTSDWEYMEMANTNAQTTNWTYYDGAEAPNATTFKDGWPNNTEMITYCFHSVSGYSKFGSYSGNGGSNSITGLGFQPDFVMIKSTGSNNWMVYDSVRSVSVGDNAGTANARPYIIANNSGKENGVTSYNVNLDSDGFSMNTSAGDLNTNAQTYIYMAFKMN